ncbi:MAG: hypothetical protein A2521_15935 [Deltaproteobacteria bacterium RIFOXYD12_FULL_57_12]|nr:MAG: hypothetical protein A2521_15935 [Deltaproteobacteria bacterium RIFOXYD12_FULL_57_12]
MFPLKDDIPSNTFPVVNIGLIAVNFLFFLMELEAGQDFERLVFALGFVPGRFMSGFAENWLNIKIFLPVFSSMFLHGGILHLVSNMWMLWIFGDNVEDCMGHGRYLFFYLLCGVISVFAQAAAGPGSQVPLIGASGAISGVLGAYFLTYPRARVLTLIPIFILFYTIELPAYFFLGFWFFMQFLQGSASLATIGNAQGGIAFWAHVGGFGAGVLLIHLFRRTDWQKTIQRKSVRLTRI